MHDGNAVHGDAFPQPFTGYDEVAPAELAAHLVEVTVPDEVFAIAAYEERHQARPDVLRACGRRAAWLLYGLQAFVCPTGATSQ